MINKISTISKKTGKEVFIYKYDDGKFASKALYEEQEASTLKQRKKKITPEEIIPILDKQEEWVGESGVYQDPIKEEIEKKIADFEKELDEEIEKVSTPIKEVQEVKSSGGFFSTWFKFWNW